MKRTHPPAPTLYAMITVVLYGGIASGMLLGFFKLYYPPLVIIVSILCAGSGYYLYKRFSNTSFYTSVLDKKAETQQSRVLSWVLYAAGLLLFAALILLPVIRWPASIAADWFPFDAAKYHFPKAIEMFRTGSAWDFSLAYAQYPYGYESLLGLGLSLTHSEMLFGWIHALVDIFFVLTIWMLSRRYTRIPSAPLFFLSVFLLISEMLPIPYNMWALLRMMSQTIGKNDLLVGAAMLAAVFHAPVGPRHNQHQQHLIGLGLTSMIAISVKPNALIVIAPLWLLSLYQIISQRSSLTISEWKPKIIEFITGALLAVPGGLWAIRNLIEQGVLFTEPIKNIQGWSIANNLTNPYFYNYIPKYLMVMIVILFLSILSSLIIKRPTRTISLAFLALFLSFIMSPVSAFFLNTDVPADIAWRFAVGVLIYLFLVILIYLDPLITFIYKWINKSKILNIVLTVIIAAFTIIVISTNSIYLKPVPANSYIVKDYYQDPVGADGYHSVYDYIRQNIQNAVIWEEGGLPYYLFGTDYTNSVSRNASADYVVVFRLVYEDGVTGPYPDFTGEQTWENQWEMIYEDKISRLYERR